MTHDIALIPGDGIAKEVVAEARRVLEQVGEIWDFDFEWTDYKYRREQRDYGETVVVSTQSLIEKHPELKENLGDDLKLPAREDASTPSYKTQGGLTVPAPEGGPRFVTEFVTEKPSPEVSEEEGDIDRIRSLLDELEEIENQAQAIKRREQEIKKALKNLIMERY